MLYAGYVNEETEKQRTLTMNFTFFHTSKCLFKLPVHYLSELSKARLESFISSKATI